MLYRGEGVDVLPERQDDDPARMLAGRPADADAAGGDAVDLTAALVDALFLIIIPDVAVGGLVRQRADRAGAEGLAGAEDDLRIFVRLAWYSPEKFRSISGSLLPPKPRKVSNGMLKPSLSSGFPQTGQTASGMSQPAMPASAYSRTDAESKST